MERNCSVGQPPWMMITLPAHGMVLDIASTYFRARLIEAWQAASQQSGPEAETTQQLNSDDEEASQRFIARESAGKRMKVMEGCEAKFENAAISPSPSRGKRMLIEHVEEEEVSAVKAVIKSIHTGKLDEELSNSPAQILQCYMIASRFGVQRCMEDCATALNNIPHDSITVDILLQIYSFPAYVVEYCSHGASTFQKEARTALLTIFGDIPSILSAHRWRTLGRGASSALGGNVPSVYGALNTKAKGTRALLKKFLSLPHAAVLQWLKLDELNVHSENCVVALLTLWMVGDNGKACNISQRIELLENIRVLQLTSSYLCNMLTIAWDDGAKLAKPTAACSILASSLR